MTDPKPIREQVAELLHYDYDMNYAGSTVADFYEQTDRILALVRPEPLVQIHSGDVNEMVQRLTAERDELRGMLEIAAPEYAGICKERDEALRVIGRLTSDDAVDVAQDQLTTCDSNDEWCATNDRSSVKAAITAALTAARGTG